MSRFRFRVYDKINNRYVDGSPDCYFIDQLGDLIKISEHDDHLDRVQDKDNFIVEQYTGLRDKNGTLIYEGDIVLYGESENEIIWHKEWGGFARVSCAKKRLGLKLDYWELFDHESTKFEIIGNVHDMEVKDE